VSINTVTKLLVDAGIACAKYQDETLRNLPCKRLQCDEIWSFCYCKQKERPGREAGSTGLWRRVDVDRDRCRNEACSLIPRWRTKHRTRDRLHEKTSLPVLAGRVQLTTDGLKFYLEAVGLAFKGEIDYAMLMKRYGNRAGREWPLQPRRVPWMRQERSQGQSRARNTFRQALSSDRTSRCG